MSDLFTCCLGSFLGSFITTTIVLLLFARNAKMDTSESDTSDVLQREPPKGIGMYADPLERYNRYQDYDSKLYNPINDTKGEIKVDRKV